MRRAACLSAWSLLVLAAGCRAPAGDPPATPAPPPARAAATPAPTPTPAPPGEVPLFDGLGPHRRAIATSSPDAQRYFDQGVAFLYAFNHDEAIRSFQRAAELDPDAAMAWWGVAVANGPHINNPVVDRAHERAGYEAARRARDRAASASDADRALIEAVAVRYADPQPADRAPLDLAYAGAMRRAWSAHPRDADIGALFAEALMDLRPWDLWRADGSPYPETVEALAALDAVLALDPAHPLANHLYIHAVEASPHPERADAAADRLRDLAPGLGHLVHMPSHIDVRQGRWEQAVEANRKAMAADRDYRARSPHQGFYRIYMAHNHHMLAFAAMMRGQKAPAIEAIDQMVADMPASWLREHAAFADGFTAMPLEVRMRFGMWDEILAAPEPADYLPVARAMRRYARGVAYAAKGQVAEARAEQEAFRAARARVAEDATFGNNRAHDLLEVAERLLSGEVRFRAGDVAGGLQDLARAVEAEDALRYDEPPDWIQPVRHAYGAALLQAGRTADAERVYREDLARLGENGWSLYGLGRSLRLQGRDVEAAEVEARFARAWSAAEVKIASSCFCQSGV